MPLLARPAGPKPRRPRKAAERALPPMAIVGATVEAKLGGVTVTALPEGALWIAEAKALVVSDLHLEKGSSFALRGQMLPPYDTHAGLMRLTDLMLRLSPEIIVSLGDSFHDGGGPGRMDARDRQLLTVLMSRCDWVWVEGNHDGRASETLGGAGRDVLHLGPLVLRHHPTKGAAAGEIAGHLHPCAKVAGRGTAVRRRCFALGHDRLVMPAFGAFTGGLNVCDEAFAPIFPDGATALVMGRDKVLPAPMQRLLPD
ncbi:MAG TPA: ligase-associated DNA damage response endonuclease PdeM [Candidatus Binatia bacterium]|nr:ligase-associated DNA damage response endonuclease PdeM [Candidatus Binatia bacterium]